MKAATLNTNGPTNLRRSFMLSSGHRLSRDARRGRKSPRDLFISRVLFYPG